MNIVKATKATPIALAVIPICSPIAIKIMRRILRKIAANEHDQLGDTTTLADPSVVQSLVDNRKNI